MANAQHIYNISYNTVTNCNPSPNPFYIVANNKQNGTEIVCKILWYYIITFYVVDVCTLHLNKPQQWLFWGSIPANAIAPSSSAGS